MLSGRALRRELARRGIDAQKIVRKRDSGAYVADFFIPDMKEAIDPSHEWAQRLQQTLPDIQIVDTHDTVANWRPGHPVIHATVIFHLPEDSVA